MQSLWHAHLLQEAQLLLRRPPHGVREHGGGAWARGGVLREQRAHHVVDLGQVRDRLQARLRLDDAAVAQQRRPAEGMLAASGAVEQHAPAETQPMLLLNTKTIRTACPFRAN